MKQLCLTAAVAILFSIATSYLYNSSRITSLRYSNDNNCKNSKSTPECDLNYRDFAAKIANYEEYQLSFGPTRLDTPCIIASMDKIRNTRELYPAFKECREELASVLPVNRFELNDQDIYSVFVTIVANRLAEYGTSKAMKIKDLFASKYLNCAQHSLFITHFIKKHAQRGTTIERIGLDGEGYIGNHSLVSYKRGSVNILLDGTSSLVAFVNFDDVINGKIISTYDIYDFYRGTDEAIEILRRKVRGALRLGAIRPEHIIYRETIK